MKTSDKILLSTISVIFASTVFIITGMGIYFYGNSIPLEKLANGSTKTESRDFPLGDFKKVRSGGTWEVEIVKADERKVTVTAPSVLMDFIKPEVNAVGTLLLNQWFLADPGDLKLKAVIFMPELDFLEASGSAGVHFTGFKCKRLDLRVLDASRVTGSGSSIEDLTVTGSGTARIDLGSCPAVNAAIDLPWTGEITLRMNGGRLSGKIFGNSRFTYSGTVREMELDTTAMVKIVKVLEE